MSEEFENMVIEILEIVGEDPENNLLKCAEKIHTLADYSRKTKFWIDAGEAGRNFYKEFSPVEIYNHMIIKIVESPTVVHRDGAVILTIPYLSDKLISLIKLV